MSKDSTPFDALQTALIRAGSQSALARICGVGQPAVWKWLQSGKRLPPQYVLKVEAKTGVSRHDLRPDIYPPELHASNLDEFSSISFDAQPVAFDRAGISHRRDAA